MSLGWTWVKSAGTFAGVAGILAAFTISAIVLVLSVPPPYGNAQDKAKSSQHLFYAFLVALYSFVAAAFLFADITGEVQNFTARSFFTGTFAGTITALAVVQLLLAIIWSGAEYNPRLPLRGATSLFIAITALAGIMVLIDQGDFFTATSPDGVDWFDAYPFLAWVGLLILVILPLSLGYITRWLMRQIQRHEYKSEQLRPSAYYVHDIALALSGGVTTVLTAAVSILRELNPTVLIGIYTPLASMMVMALFGFSVYFFALSLPYQKLKESQDAPADELAR